MAAYCEQAFEGVTVSTVSAFTCEAPAAAAERGVVLAFRYANDDDDLVQLAVRVPDGTVYLIGDASTELERSAAFFLGSAPGAYSLLVSCENLFFECANIDLWVSFQPRSTAAPTGFPSLAPSPAPTAPTPVPTVGEDAVPEPTAVPSAAPSASPTPTPTSPEALPPSPPPTPQGLSASLALIEPDSCMSECRLKCARNLDLVLSAVEIAMLSANDIDGCDCCSLTVNGLSGLELDGSGRQDSFCSNFTFEARPANARTSIEFEWESECVSNYEVTFGTFLGVSPQSTEAPVADPSGPGPIEVDEGKLPAHLGLVVGCVAFLVLAVAGVAGWRMRKAYYRAHPGARIANLLKRAQADLAADYVRNGNSVQDSDL